MKTLLIRNSKFLLVWGALFIGNYCLGGKVGLGITLVIFAIIQAL
jgi:hypothetical protein